MAAQKIYSFSEGTREELEKSEIPLAVYQLIDGRIKTILCLMGLFV